jgi:hypothetical protein
VVADPVALALISPPLALSTKIEELFGLLTPLPHKKNASKTKGNEKNSDLEQDTLIPGYNGSLLFVQVHLFPFNPYISLYQKSLKQTH